MKKILALLALALATTAVAQTPTYVRFSQKGPRVDVTHPYFGNGAPVLTLTTGGACTSSPTIAISAPQSALDGSQALASGYCVDGQVVSYVTFPGGGYSSASCTVTGGGTSGAPCTVSLMSSGSQADPTGANDATAAIQNAIDYAYDHGATSNLTPSVYIPQGEYSISHRILLPCDVVLRGDGSTSSILNLTDTSEDGIDVTSLTNHPNGWDCRGSLRDLSVVASQGANYTATQISVLGMAGYVMQNVTVSGGGGRGIVINGGSERNFLKNIEIDTVRWPLILEGNESHVIKLNVSGPGDSDTLVTEPDGTQGYYCWGTGTCVNGSEPSFNWSGGTLEYASSNGATATFYVHSSSSSYPNSPISTGMLFEVVGTTGTSLDGDYTATSVTNNITSDPSGQCSSSNVCFEVQAASVVSGTATLTAPSTTATFASSASTITVASVTGFDRLEYISGTGIPSGTRITSISGDILTISNPTTAAETNVTVTGQTNWWPEVAPDSNAAVTFSSAAGQIMDGSIKTLQNANCIKTSADFGSSISHLYCEGYPLNGRPTLDSTLQYGGDLPYTTLTASLPGNSYSHELVGVASDSWFDTYVNDPAQAYGQGVGGLGGLYVIEPQDFSYGSTTASAYVSGVEQGQHEVVWGVFTGGNQFEIIARNQSGSTAPAGTTWPLGSIVAQWGVYSGSGYGSLQVSNMHANSINGPGSNWSALCNDQSETGDVCGEYILGNLINEKGSFSTGQASNLAGIAGASLTLVDNEPWNAGAAPQGVESLGEGFIKAVGRGGSAYVIAGAALSGSSYGVGSGYGYEAASGDLFRDHFVNVQSFDGSYPWSQYQNSDGTFWSQGLGYGSLPGEGVVAIAAQSSQNLTGSPTNSAMGMQFQNSYCYWDTSSTVNGHAQARWCFKGGPIGGAPQFEMDTWNGTAWVNAFTLNGATPSTSGNNTFTGNNTFSTGGTQFGTSANAAYFVLGGNNFYEYNSAGTQLVRINQYGQGSFSGAVFAPAVQLTDAGSNAACATSNSSTDFYVDDASCNNDALGTVHASRYEVLNTPGYTGTANTSTSGCSLTISGGIITGASGC